MHETAQVKAYKASFFEGSKDQGCKWLEINSQNPSKIPSIPTEAGVGSPSSDQSESGCPKRKNAGLMTPM